VRAGRGRLTEDERAVLRTLIHTGRVVRSVRPDADLVDAMTELGTYSAYGPTRDAYLANVAYRAYALFVVRFLAAHVG
jgi:hypothetical protein